MNYSAMTEADAEWIAMLYKDTASNSSTRLKDAP